MKTNMIPLLDLNAQDRPARRAILKAMREVIGRNEFIQSPVVGRFEEALSKWLSKDACLHVVGVNSGTAALFLALKAMGVCKGDEVVTTPFTFIATVEAIVYAGAKPVFADIEPDTFCISPEAVERVLSARTKAILPVHLYGHPADMDRLSKLARQAGARILEDAAQAHGATWKGRNVGKIGTAAGFSFYPGKNLGAYGDAGAVVTADQDIAEHVRLLRNHGRKDKYFHKIEGYNERLDGIQAAILLAKLPYLNRWVRQRQSLAARYDRFLKKYSWKPPKVRPQATHAYHLYTVRVGDREKVQAALKEAGISTAVHYPTPLHLQPCYAYLGYRPGNFPESERASREVLSLPLYPGMTRRQQDRVIQAIRKIAGAR